jgi:hypothetical protein
VSHTWFGKWIEGGRVSLVVIVRVLVMLVLPMRTVFLKVELQRIQGYLYKRHKGQAKMVKRRGTK